jgi:hypothetical protein
MKTTLQLNRTILTAGLIACAAPAEAMVHFSSAALAVTGTQEEISKQRKSKKPSSSNPSKEKKPEKEEEKSKAESFQENLKTAKEAYEKVGAEILDGNYSKALEGATDMAKDKLIEKAEDALKQKNESLYKAYKHGKDIKDDVMKGDYAAAWDKTKDAAYDEAKEYVEDKIIEKIIPGYGQVKGAWDAGYAAGELIGQVPISADGRTVNDMAEDQMRQSFFGGQDTASSRQEAYNEVVLALVKSVKNGEYKLPQYMTFGDAREIIQENMEGNRPPFEGFRAWAANELSDDDVTETAETRSAVPPAQEKPIETQPASNPLPAPEPVEEDPWAAEPLPTKQVAAKETSEPITEPTAEPEEDIWAVEDTADSSIEDERYRLQQQLEADKERARAIADSENYQKFAVAEAKREEQARIKAEKKRKFQAGMQALAQGLGQVAQQIQQAQQGGLPQGTPGSPGGNGKRTPTAAEKAAAIYRACVQRTGDNKGCRSMAGTGVQLDSDLSKGKIPMDFIKKTCRQDSDSEKNYERCVSDRVAEMKRRMGQ